jgi:hypothetical protein
MRTIVSVLAASAFPLALSAQQSWQEELQQDLVEVRAGKMVVEGFSLDRVALPQYEPVEFQVGYYAEAPASGVISRDNFVAFTTLLTVTALQQIIAQAYNVSAIEFLEAYESHDLQQPIGRPDLEIKVYMTAEGFQLEVANTSTGESSRSTQTWDSMLGAGR